MLNKKLVRLNKYIAFQGTCSRREADRLITNGAVLVNNRTITEMGYKIDPTIDKVSYNFDVDTYKSDKTTVMLYKPCGYVVSTQTDEGPTIYELLTELPDDIVPIGRLDKDSSGLLLCTNDTSLPSHIIGENSNCEKEYAVEVNRTLYDNDLKRLRTGVMVLDKMTKPAVVRRLKRNSFKIILTEGRNRQIRRMCEVIGTRVIRLKRFRVGNIWLKNLEPGKWRILDNDEVADLKNYWSHK